MKIWPIVMEFWDQSWNFTTFLPKFYQICAFFADIKKFSKSLESLHIQTFSTICHECKIKQRDSHGKVIILATHEPMNYVVRLRGQTVVYQYHIHNAYVFPFVSLQHVAQGQSSASTWHVGTKCSLPTGLPSE